MDELYANTEEVLADHKKLEGMRKTSESIYANQDLIESVELTRGGPAISGTVVAKKSSCKLAAVFLGLLCCLLLAGLITVVIFFTRSRSHWEVEMVLFNNSYNNLTAELDNLQTTCNNLAGDRESLQKRFDDMTRKRNELQTVFQACQKEWMCVSGGLYSISSSKKSWRESRADCLLRGADLMIIDSKEKQEFARRFGKSVWIGLTDMENEGTWKWVDGTLLSKSFWATGEPNGNSKRDEDCAEIKNFESQSSWNDELCDLQKHWICEKKPIALV